MEDEHKEAFFKAFNYFYKGNQNAVALSLKIMEVLHTWDDFVDCDPVSEDRVNQAFRFLIYDIPKNPVYQAIPSLSEHLLNVYLRWRDATAMEREDTPDLEKTYMLRAGCYDIFSLIAYHLYGDEWAKKIGPDIRKLYGETLDDLKKEFSNA